MTDVVEIYTDGACRGNPGPGGWGALLRYKGKEKTLYGGEAETTNNRMELRAAIEALKSLKRPCQALLTTDSQYLRKGITEWISSWKRNGWKTAARKPVKNADLWERLDAAAARVDAREAIVAEIIAQLSRFQPLDRTPRPLNQRAAFGVRRDGGAVHEK